MNSMLMQKVKIGNSRFGKGVFTNSSIRKGEFIFRFTGKRITFLDTIRLGEAESYSFQTDRDSYLKLDEPYCLINHSCEPNCGINRNLELIAIKDIKVNQELFYDYSTSMFERHWQMKCHCNSANCRQIIKDFDYLPMEIIRKYLELDIVQPFIKNLINA